MKKKTVGIIGGVGPEATVDVFHWIVDLTPAKQDSDHIPALIHNNPQVPSRAEAILHNGEDPSPVLINMAKQLEEMGADFLIMPCNTAHYYFDQIQNSISIPLLNMVECTTTYALSQYPKMKKVGLLATEMTARTGIYQQSLVRRELDVVHDERHHRTVDTVIPNLKPRYFHHLSVELDDEHEHDLKKRPPAGEDDFTVLFPRLSTMRKKVMKSIFGEKGIKAGHHSEPKRLLINAANELKKDGAEAIILACTEIPLALQQEDVPTIPLINPTKILAQKAVDVALGNENL